MEKKKKMCYAATTLCCSLLLYVVIFAICGFYPFGDLTTLAWDLDGQYLAFMSYFRNIIANRDFSLYSQSIALGSGTVGLLAYYLLSPFNFLLLFFSTESLPAGVTLIILVKHIFSALTMFYFLTVRYTYMEQHTQNRDMLYRFASLFAIVYSLSGFAVNMQFNIMWLDGLIILPLICVALEQLVRENKSELLVFSLCIALITNFYMGYMLWLFSFMYFIFLRIECGIKKERYKNWFHYVGAVLRAAGLSMILILPLLYSLSISCRRSDESKVLKIVELLCNEKTILIIGGMLLLGVLAIVKSNWIKKAWQKEIKRLISFVDMFMEEHLILSIFLSCIMFLLVAVIFLNFVNVFSNKGFIEKEILYLPLKLFIGAFNQEEIRGGLPNIYVSGLVMIIVLQFIASLRINLREKIAHGILLGGIFLSMFVKRVNYIWHGFAYPHGSPYRYSFLISFILILIASQYIVMHLSGYPTELKKELEKKQKIIYIAVGTIMVSWIAFSLYKYPELESDFLTYKKIFVTTIFYLLIVLCLKLVKAHASMLPLLGILVGFELCCNAVVALKTMDYTGWDTFQSEAKTVSNILVIIEGKDDGVYRIENPDLGANSALLYDYDSVSHYSSVMPIQAVTLLNEFGVKPEQMGDTQTMYKVDVDAQKAGLLNIKYVLAKTPLETAGWQHLFTYKDYYIYENLIWKQRGMIIAEKYITDSVEDFISGALSADCDTAQLCNDKKDEMAYRVENKSDENSRLVLSVAYDKGWSATIDNKPVVVKMAYDSLLSVDVVAGVQKVIFKYFPPYLKQGAMITALFIFGEFCRWRYRNKYRN